jgi:catechol 2,3-dioxygenase-like lactoylglutathione lyase family enzyme
MTLVQGLNHIAILTGDLDRFIAFYTEVFELEPVFREDTPAFRHAILRTGPNSWLHPAEVTGSQHGAGSSVMFDRGHLDHVALTATSSEAFYESRRRLISRGATDGQVEDLGSFHALWFTDPDGMRIELTVIIDPQLASIHAPRPLTTGS